MAKPTKKAMPAPAPKKGAKKPMPPMQQGQMPMGKNGGKMKKY